MTVRITRVSPLDSPDQRTEAALRSLRREIAPAIKGVGRDGAFSPVSMTDAEAINGTLYFSTTASKLVYKDSSGAVHDLY